MSRADSVIGAGLALTFLAMGWMAAQLPIWAQFAPGAGFAPLLYSLTGAAVALYVAVRGLRAPSVERPNGGGLLRVAAAVVALVIAVAAVPILGFFVALAGYLLLLTFVVQRLRPVVALASAGGTIALVYLLFGVLLRVPFPKGWFGI
jgi:hypothetical protein